MMGVLMGMLVGVYILVLRLYLKDDFQERMIVYLLTAVVGSSWA